MNDLWLILDTTYLSHRAFHSTGGLAHGGEPTGVAYGVLRDVKTLMERFQTDNIAFAFDRGRGLREQAHPFYKERRRKRNLTPDEETARAELQGQIEKLRTDYLPALGFGNIFAFNGYEADDCIAQAVRTLPGNSRAIMVSADADLYQLLGRSAAFYNPGKRDAGIYTAKMFKAEYGIKPADWVYVKAIAGCPTDDIPGVPGVGEITAVKYLRGEYGRGVHYGAILSFMTSPEYYANLELVELPYPKCPPCSLKPDGPGAVASLDKWNKLCERLGMQSLVEDRSRQPIKR